MSNGYMDSRESHKLITKKEPWVESYRDDYCNWKAWLASSCFSQDKPVHVFRGCKTEDLSVKNDNSSLHYWAF